VDVAPTATAPFTPLLADAARFCRHSPGDRWFTDETYVKINGHWRYVYRAKDQHGQVIDVLVSTRARRPNSTAVFQHALTTLKVVPVEVVTDGASAYPAVLDKLIPSARHHVERYANNPVESDMPSSSSDYEPCADCAPTEPHK